MTRLAVVTGGASGIGRSICLHLARHGDTVTVLDWDGDGAEQVVKEIEADGGRALACRVDVSDRAQVDAAMATARSVFGPVGIVVTSAAVSNVEPFVDIPLEAWNRTIAINLTGTFHCVQSAISDMIDARWGRVVMISSSSAQRGAARMAQYASSKGGVIALTRALALEFAPVGITVNNIAPSLIDTPMVDQQAAAGRVASSEEMARNVPIGRMGTGDDIAAACLFLCSDLASYVTGQTMSVNGGSFIGW